MLSPGGGGGDPMSSGGLDVYIKKSCLYLFIYLQICVYIWDAFPGRRRG